VIDLEAFIGSSKRFSWREVLWLPRWEICSVPSCDQIANLEHVIEKLDQVCLLISRDVEITSGLRPRIYNDLIGGAKKSPHLDGLAIDFYPKNMHKGACNVIRALLKPRLNDLQIRMEDHSGEWIHIDCRTPGHGGRFFKP